MGAEIREDRYGIFRRLVVELEKVPYDVLPPDEREDAAHAWAVGAVQKGYKTVEEILNDRGLKARILDDFDDEAADERLRLAVTAFAKGERRYRRSVPFSAKRSLHRAGNGPAPSDPSRGPDPEMMMRGCRLFLQSEGSGHLHTSFELGCAGDVDGSIAEFEIAELQGQVNAAAYHDHAMMMFIHGRIGRADSFARDALAADPQIELHPALQAILREFPDAFDDSGMLKGESVERFTSMRIEFLRMIVVPQQPPTS